MYKNGTIIPYSAQEHVSTFPRVKAVEVKLIEPKTVPALEPSLSLPMSANKAKMVSESSTMQESKLSKNH